ncbi:MAG TPA: sulfur carrier protein ThiS [Gammaproteobacteria bacterium]|nr:sulfur carrier protein ThiS [Gammaproteobacteria bacterium]
MNIVLNGEPRPVNSGTHLEQLVQELGLKGKRLAVEINREIIPRSQYANTELKNGDTIEIVHAIGGG